VYHITVEKCTTLTPDKPVTLPSNKGAQNHARSGDKSPDHIAFLRGSKRPGTINLYDYPKNAGNAEKIISSLAKTGLHGIHENSRKYISREKC
jgi:hypothetical protein